MVIFCYNPLYKLEYLLLTHLATRFITIMPATIESRLHGVAGYPAQVDGGLILIHAHALYSIKLPASASKVVGSCFSKPA